MKTAWPRAYFLTVAAVGVAAQLWIVFLAFRYGSVLQTFLTDLGVVQPIATASFLATYRWWLVSPVVSALLSADVARRPEPPRSYVIVVLLLTVAAAGVLEAWMHEAWFGPLVQIIRQLH